MQRLLNYHPYVSNFIWNDIFTCLTMQVFFVDYGMISTISDVDVRSLKPEYLILPFQAVECFLPDMHISSSYINKQQEARLTVIITHVCNYHE